MNRLCVGEPVAVAPPTNTVVVAIVIILMIGLAKRSQGRMYRVVGRVSARRAADCLLNIRLSEPS